MGGGLVWGGVGGGGRGVLGGGGGRGGAAAVGGRRAGGGVGGGGGGVAGVGGPPTPAGPPATGPAARLIPHRAPPASVGGGARLYAPLASRLVIDEADRDLADAVRAEGIDAVVAPTMMYGPPDAAARGRVVLS